MPKPLGALILHGIGSQGPTYADGLIERVERHLPHDQRGRTDWEPVYWADVLARPQADLWRRLVQDNDLDYVRIRKFLINALGNVAAYQQSGASAQHTYAAIHERLFRGLSELRERLGGRDAPLVVLAHSLGGHIVSNYIWDRQHGGPDDRFGPTALHRFESLAGLITFGCPIPLFVLAFKRVLPVAFPPPGLAASFPPGTDPARLREAALWLNYYDQDDVLGYPLKPISAEYDATVHEDVNINAGDIFSSWNPLSHAGYWEEEHFARPVAAMLARLLALL
jgi:hypothetical protein